MEVIRDLNVWRELRKGVKGEDVGCVPTMGALHLGHRSLLERCRRENSISVLTIFVNPTQFDQPQDLKSYPKTFEADCQMAHEVGIDYILAPTYEQIYEDGYRFKVVEKEISGLLCGEHRPGHFDGVLTIVMKLLHLVQPRRAYFGEKDFQQMVLIQDMVKAFFMDVDIVPCPVVREESGLAMSSRNRHLSEQNRILASNLFHHLSSLDESCDQVKEKLSRLGFDVDYVEERFGRRLGAVRLSGVRLIDNVQA